MRNVLNVLADILTLMALCVAAIGHVLPWFNDHMTGVIDWLARFQQWHSERSGTALGALGLLVGLSLIINWGPEMRRVLNVLMFCAAVAALLFELMIFTNAQTLFMGGQPLSFRDTAVGFRMSMIATASALFLTVFRMLWTMPPTRTPKALPVATPADLDRPPEKKIHPF